jgi:uncharacterized protein (DUF1800 family)
MNSKRITAMKTSNDPWSPFEPTRDDPWDLGKVAHLHRRAGFGATLPELERDLMAGPAASVKRLVDPPRGPSADDHGTLDRLRDGVLNAPEARVERLKAYWLYRIVYGPDPVREKSTLFWHGHFATSNRKVQNVERMLAQNELIRRLALGDFRELAVAILSEPAMLIWLDGVGNSKEKPNENLAREFLELFTLGVGHYTEVDIRQAARALTGWLKEGDEGDYAAPLRFDPARFDDGAKTFLGRTGHWSASDIARIALEQPPAASHLARKLYRFFVRDDVEPGFDFIDPLADRIRASGFSIRKALDVIFRSRHFYSVDARRHLIKSPVEIIAGLVRSLAIPRSRIDLVTLACLCDRQGQSLFYPPNVKGWDGGRAWVSSATLLARSNWVSDLVWGSRSLAIEPFDPSAWARDNRIAPEHIADRLADLLLQDDLGAEARSLALRGGRGSGGDELRQALQILLNCPEFQLA